MIKFRLIILCSVFSLLIGIAAGWIMARYFIGTQLSTSEAFQGGVCSTENQIAFKCTGKSGVATIDNCTPGRCQAQCGTSCYWIRSAQ